MTSEDGRHRLPKRKHSENILDEFTAFYNHLDDAVALTFSASPDLTKLQFICEGARQLTIQIPPNHHAAKALLDSLPHADSVEAIITLLSHELEKLEH